MKLRLCVVDFKKVIRIQVGGSIKTKKPQESLTVIELGDVESFGKSHFSGVISEDIVNTRKVRNNIEELEGLSPEDRMEWFSSNFPKARIIKIESSQILDRLKDTKQQEKKEKDRPVIISSSVDLKWSK